MRISSSSKLIAIVVAWVATVVVANNVPDVPDDLTGINRTLLIHDAFDAEETMTDLGGDKQIDLQEYIRQLFMFNWRLPIIDASTMHQYHSLKDKLISGGPKINHTDCSVKLRFLVNRVEQEQKNGRPLVSQSSDYRLFNLLDSYGRPEGSFIRGVLTWLGDYDQCIEARYDYPDTSSDDLTLSGSRYCLAHLRWPRWKHTEGFNEWKYSTVKSAVCLPETCDSLAAEQEENKQMLSKLMAVNFGASYAGYQIGNVYCLPDKESPLTQWRNDPAAICVIIFFVTWLLWVTVSTIIDIYEVATSVEKKVIRIFSFRVNVLKLFDMAKLRSPVESAETNNKTAKEKEVSFGNMKETTQQHSPIPVIDLNYLHCVKVLLLFIVMKTHFFLFFTPTIRIIDMIKAWNSFAKYHLMLGAMGVNNFLMITGALIAYKIFTRFPAFSSLGENRRLSSGVILANNSGLAKDVANRQQQQQQQQHPIMKPSVWLAFCTSRYFRIMPMWVIVTLVAKYLAKYIGSGPSWDYGTSTDTNLYLCQHESWFYTLLAVVNLRPEYQNCIPSAWYLAIDLQCTIVIAPMMIVAYLKAPRAAFPICLALPVVHFVHYLASDVYIPDLVRGITRVSIEPLAFTTVFGHELNKIYHYTPLRATYFLMGITSGYMLHIYETNIRHSEAIKATEVQFIARLVDIIRMPIVSNWLTATILFLLSLSPMFLLTHLPEQYHMFYFGTATIYVCLALTVLLYAYLVPVILIQLSTGSLGNGLGVRKFLNWPGWLPLSRISLTFLLLDPLIVLIINGRLQHTLRLNYDMLVLMMIAQSVVIYLVSIVVYLMMESPMKSCLAIIQVKLLGHIQQ